MQLFSKSHPNHYLKYHNLLVQGSVGGKGNSGTSVLQVLNYLEMVKYERGYANVRAFNYVKVMCL